MGFFSKIKKDDKFFFLVFSICWFTLFQICNGYSFEQETIFSKIASHYLTAFSKPSFTHEEIKILTDKKNPNYKENFQTIINRKKTEIKNKKIIFELFEQNEYSKEKENQNIPTPSLISETFWKDLELFYGEHTPSCHLLSKINKTQTHSGTVMLAKTIAEPTIDITELTRRQDITKELIENEELFKQLDSILKNYANIETELLSFWDEKSFNTLFTSNFYHPMHPLDLLPNKILDVVFPKKKRSLWNQSDAKLEALTILNNITSVRRIINELTNVSLYWDRAQDNFSEFWGYETSRIQKPLDKKNPIEKAFYYINYYTIGLLKQYTIDQLAKMCPKQITTILKKSWNVEQTFWNIAQIPISIFDVYKSIKKEIKKLKILKRAYLKIKKAALAVNSVIEIKKIIDANPELKEKINCFDEIKYLFDGSSSKSKEFDNLLNLLRCDTFKDPNCFNLLFSRGKILSTSYLMIEAQDHLVDILQALGQIDTYLSLAKLYKESKDKNATYSFANYSQQQTPYIYLKEFWTPFINQEKVITNNIELGNGGRAKNVVISGPNAGGKSTILKSIMINLLLAQTIGIVPAKKLTITPFLYLDTYLNITDDISAGNSLFKSEVLRVKQLLQTIKKISQIGLSFVIMDEIFSGTNPLEGEAAGYAIGRYLADIPKNIAMIASHFPKMTNLENDTGGIFKNYKVSVQKSENKTLNYPFKLEEGKTNQTIAISILEAENFDKQIIDNAYAVINNGTY